MDTDMPTSSSLPTVHPRAVPPRMKHAYVRGPSAVNVNETVDLRLRETPRSKARAKCAQPTPGATRRGAPRARCGGCAGDQQVQVQVRRGPLAIRSRNRNRIRSGSVRRDTGAGIADCLNCRGPGRSGDYGLCQAVEYRNAGGTKWVSRCWCG